MKRGGSLHPATPDCWPPTKRPWATLGGLIAAGVTCLSRREGVSPCLRTSPPSGGTLEVHRTSWRIPFPRPACTFLVLGFRGAWLSHAPPRVPKQSRPLDSALPPASGSRLAGSAAWHGLPQCPGYRHWVSYCCVAFVFGSGLRLGVGLGNPASPGWGLWRVCLGTICGVVPLSPAGVCGVPGWAWVSACIWDVRGCVGAPRAPSRFRSRCAVWACVLGYGFRLRPATPWVGVGVCVCWCAPPAWSPAPPGWGCCARVRVCARAPLVPRLSWLGCAVWACMLGPGLGCAPPFLVGLLGCVFFFGVSCFGFVVLVAGCPCPGPCGPCPPIPSLSRWVAVFFFRPSVVCVCAFGCPLSRRAAARGLVLPVLAGWSPCAPLGVLSSVPSGWVVWPPLVVLAGGLVAVARSLAPPPSPPFFSFSVGVCLFLPLPSVGWRTHSPAFSVVLRVAVGGCVLLGSVPAPWVGWVMYTFGSAPLTGGLDPGSVGSAAAPGSFVWLWVRGPRLSVSFLLRDAGFILLGGPPPLLPGARWPRGWPAVPVCGVLVRRLSGVCGGLFWLVLQVRVSRAMLCRSVPRRITSCCGVLRFGVRCRGALHCGALRCGVPCCLVLCRGGSVEVSLACVVVRSAGRSVAGWWLGGAVWCGWLAGSVLWGPGRAARAGGSGRCLWGCPPWGPVPWSCVLWGSRSLALGAVAVSSSSSGACDVALVVAGVVAWR